MEGGWSYKEKKILRNEAWGTNITLGVINTRHAHATMWGKKLRETVVGLQNFQCVREREARVQRPDTRSSSSAGQTVTMRHARSAV
jgi:hypothetical protein